MADEDDIMQVPTNELRQEEGAQELAESADMEPYLNFAVALMQGNDPAPELEVLRLLPLEKRYVWRIALALKWGFADFDDLSVSADKDTLTPDGFLQGDGPFEIAAHAVLHLSESPGGR